MLCSKFLLKDLCGVSTSIVTGDVNFVQSEDIWFNAPRKGVLVFALPGERCVADINGDFKIQFSDRHGDFYWYAHPPIFCILRLFTRLFRSLL